ncbi:hypothetical protein [Mesomycoplasma ovipneumoniae]
MIDNLKKVSDFGGFLTFLANTGKITIKAKTLNFKSDHHKRKIQLLFKLNANRKLAFICIELKKYMKFWKNNKQKP